MVETAPASDPTSDVVERAIDALAPTANGKILLGLVLVAIGVGVSRLVARPFDRRLPRPTPPARLDARRDFPLVASAIVGWLVAGLVGALLFRVGTLAEPTTHDDLRRVSGAIWFAALALLALLWFVTRWRGSSLREVGLVRERVGPSLLLALGLYVAFVPVELGAIALEMGAYVHAGLPLKTQALVTSFATAKTAQRDLLVVSALVLGAALGEELLFRGVLLRFAQRVLPSWLAIALVALLFATLHDARNLPVFALGLALTWLMARTGNLFAPIAFHALHNGVALLLIATTTAKG